MTPDPFIRDSAFRGSPILSYGTAHPRSVWPKFLALGAGILLLVFLLIFCWLWFFTKIPVPNGNIVQIIVPPNTELSAAAPLSWKQVKELNRPMPTIAGLAKTDNGQFADYAVRLSPGTALIGKTSLWHLTSKQPLKVNGYKTPFDVFGWPWQLFLPGTALSIYPKDLFSDSNMAWEGLPNQVNGQVLGNKWKTDLPINNTNVVNKPENENFITLEKGGALALANFISSNGAWSKTADAGTLIWDFDPYNVEIDYITQDIQAINTGFLDNSNQLNEKDFILPDGTVVKRLFLTEDAIFEPGPTTNTDRGFNLDQPGFVEESNFVSNLACDGEILASFNKQSIDNFCSWFDICHYQFQKLVFLNESGFLTVCGY